MEAAHSSIEQMSVRFAPGRLAMPGFLRCSFSGASRIGLPDPRRLPPLKGASASVWGMTVASLGMARPGIIGQA